MVNWRGWRKIKAWLAHRFGESVTADKLDSMFTLGRVAERHGPIAPEQRVMPAWLHEAICWQHSPVLLKQGGRCPVCQPTIWADPLQRPYPQPPTPSSGSESLDALEASNEAFKQRNAAYAERLAAHPRQSVALRPPPRKPQLLRVQVWEEPDTDVTEHDHAAVHATHLLRGLARGNGRSL